MVSDALKRMREVHDSGRWRVHTDATLVGMVAFMESVEPSMLLPEERDFVTGFMAVLCEHQDEQAKGGAA